MSTQIQYLRGSATQLNSFTGVAAEIVVDTTNWTLRVLDGSTVGGYPLVGLDQAQTLTNKTLVNPIITGSLNGSYSLSLTGNITTPGTVGANLISATNGSITNLTLGGTGLTQSIIPSANASYTLGNSTNLWTSLSVTNTGVNIGAATVTANATAITLTNPSGGIFSLSGTANSTVGTFTQVSATGNINSAGNISTAGSFIGDGSQLTGVSALGNLISNGTSNVFIPGAGSNVTVTVGGSANIGVFTQNGLTVAGAVTATNLTGSLTTAAQANITSVGTLTSLAVTGNASAGNISATNLTGSLATAAQANITSVGILTGLSVSGTVNAGQFNGNGNTISNIQGASVTGAVATATSAVSADSATTAGTVTSNAQANITSVGTLTSLSSSGNITGSNVIGTQLYGNGINITNINGANVTGTVPLASSAGVATLATSAQAVSSSAQPVITSVGTLTSLSVAGNVTTSGNFVGNGAALTNITASTATSATTAGTVTGNAQANITSVGTLTSLNVTGTTTSGQFSGAGNTLSNIQGANVSGNVSSAVLAYTAYSVAGANVSGTVSSATTATSATTAGTVTTAAQGNITSVGTLTSLSVSGNITGGNLITPGTVYTSDIVNSTGTGIYLAPGPSGYINFFTSSGDRVSITDTGNISAVGNIIGSNLIVGNIVNSNANGVGNIGSSTTYFNTVFAKATSAQYADLAEMYCADIKYPPGTVVEFGGELEVTQTTATHSTAVAGIVSTNPSYLMNATLDCSTAIEIALVGRVPCFVVGTIRKGDRLVSSNLPGVATSLKAADYQPGCIVGKALEAYNSDEVGTIEVAVGRV